MNINATLLVQMLTFALFIMFTMKFVWPPVMKALDDRRDKIADGMAAAERGHRELELAQTRIKEQLHQAKLDANDIIEHANKRATQIVEDAKHQAQEEGKRLARLAQEQIAQEINSVKESLRKQYAGLAVAGAERILQREVDQAANTDLLDKLIAEL